MKSRTNLNSRVMMFLFLLLMLVAVSTTTADKYVSHAGDDGNAGTEEAPFRTIQKGIDSLGANERCLLVADEDYTLETVQSGVTGEIKAGQINRFYVAEAETPSSAYIGMNLFCTGAPSDGYGYRITETNEIPGGYYGVSRNFESDSGGDANLTWYVGDQGAVSINMNNGAGDPATNKWIILTSVDAENPATIKSDSTVFNGTYNRNYINIHEDMQQIVNIIFRTDANNVTGTSGPYIIGADDPNDFSGLIVRDCQFYGCKDAMHISRQKNAVVLNNRIELGNFPAHQAGIVLGAPGGAAVANDIKGPTGVNYFASVCFGILVNMNAATDTLGTVVVGNYIHDFTSTGNYPLPFGGIGVNGGAAIIANNVIYNIQCADSEPPSDSDKWGAIYVYSMLEQGYIGLLYNNILMNCIKGINLGSGSVGYLDYNCIYNCNKAYIGTQAGPHDISADPCFVDAANGDFRLKANSPCLNTAKPTLDNGFSNMGAWQGISRGMPSLAHCTDWLEMDFNDDCKVDFSDFAIFATQWLECNLEPQELCW